MLSPVATAIGAQGGAHGFGEIILKVIAAALGLIAVSAMIETVRGSPIAEVRRRPVQRLAVIIGAASAWDPIRPTRR